MATYADWMGAEPVYLVLDPGDDTPPVKLRHADGMLLTKSSEPAPVGIASGTTAVSTLTPLTGWLDLNDYEEVIFAAASDSAPDVTLVVETSEDGVHADEVQLTSTSTTGKQSSAVKGDSNPARYWRMSAQSAAPDFAAATVAWSARGIPRI